MSPGVFNNGQSSNAIIPVIPTPSVDGTILAAVDMGTGSGIVPTRHDTALCLQVQALSKLHTQKVRTLMRSISELKRKLAIATAQGKDHRRSAMIQAMRARLREQELVVDVVKEELARKTGMGTEETNDWVIRKTVGGPLRFRPKTREELQNEMIRLEKKYRQALEKLEQKRTSKQATAPNGPSEQAEDTEEARKAAALAAGNPAVKEHTTTDAQPNLDLIRLAEALEESDDLRVSLRSRDAALQAQAEVVDRLQADIRELTGLEERLDRKERRLRGLKKKHGNLGDQHTQLLERFEKSQEQVHHLRAQLQLRKEESLAEADAFRHQSLRRAEEVGVLLKTEQNLVAALEAETAARERERIESHHSTRQALSRAETAERALAEATKQLKRVQEQNSNTIVELQCLGKEAAETSGLRERGRELARQVKLLTQEASATQERLADARDRGARAEEGLRASQELLRGEKESKKSLITEASEAKALLDVQRRRLSEETEARQRLEAMLAFEKQKELEKGIADNVTITASANAACIEHSEASKHAADRTAVQQRGNGNCHVDTVPLSESTTEHAATTVVVSKACEKADLPEVRHTSPSPALAAGDEIDNVVFARTEFEDDTKEAVAARGGSVVLGGSTQDVEANALIEEMEAELEEQSDQIIKLEDHKRAAELESTANKQVAEALRKQIAELKAQLKNDQSPAVQQVLPKDEEKIPVNADNRDGIMVPCTTEESAGGVVSLTADATTTAAMGSYRPHRSASVEREEKERHLREALASAKAAEQRAVRQALQLRADLEDAQATSELHKARVKELLASDMRVSTTLELPKEVERRKTSGPDVIGEGVTEGDTYSCRRDDSRRVNDRKVDGEGNDTNRGSASVDVDAELSDESSATVMVVEETERVST